MLLFDRPEQAVVIQTSKGNPIPHDPSLRLTEADAENKFRAMRSRYPQLNPRTKPTAQYNCHGMTFFCRRGRAFEEAIKLVLHDDGFAPVLMNDVSAGDIILYYSADNAEIDHSGLVTHVDRQTITDGKTIIVPWVLSKWGDAGEYLHRFNQGPYYEVNPHVKFVREFMREN